MSLFRGVSLLKVELTVLSLLLVAALGTTSVQLSNYSASVSSAKITDSQAQFFEIEPVERIQDQQSQTPIVDPDPTELPVDCKIEKCIALTFDDGPVSGTSKILDVLAKNNAKATFFVVGYQVKKHPKVLLRASSEGHEIGNHTLSHKWLTRLSSEAIRHQLAANRDRIAKVTGKAPTLIRPPYGAYNSRVKKLSKLPLVLWTVDPQDWKTHSTSATVRRVLNSARRNSVVLMHDIHPSTQRAVPTIVRKLIERGYRLVTVSQLRGGNLTPGRLYYPLYKN